MFVAKADSFTNIKSQLPITITKSMIKRTECVNADQRYKYSINLCNAFLSGCVAFVSHRSLYYPHSIRLSPKLLLIQNLIYGMLKHRDPQFLMGYLKIRKAIGILIFYDNCETTTNILPAIEIISSQAFVRSAQILRNIVRNVIERGYWLNSLCRVILRLEFGNEIFSIQPFSVDFVASC